MQHAFHNRQQGFTLLELLVVITLLAVLSVGALVAYENVGDNAEAAAAANTNTTIDRAIRTYRSLEGAYPNQWDVLSVKDANTAISTLSDEAKDIFGSMTLTAAVGTTAAPTVTRKVIDALQTVGINEIQYMTAALPAGIAPNRAHNESINVGAAAEFEMWDDEDGFNPAAEAIELSIMPSGGETGTCTLDTTISLATNFAGDVLLNNAIQNKYNDHMEADECHLVVALGFGSDAAASTTFSNVAISQSPTYTSSTINPSTNYARYIGLFHVGADADEDGNITLAELSDKARLVAVIAPDGKVIDQHLAEVNPAQ